MTVAERAAWPAAVRRWDTLVAVLRVALGSVFLIAGTKGVVPTLFGFADRDALVAKFVDPHTGFLAPWVVERVTSLGVPVDVLLLGLSVAEVATGLALIVGLGTRMMAFGAAVMLWSFTVAAPDAGAIRLARDLALVALCVALIRAGGGRWSLDRRIATTHGLGRWHVGGTGAGPRSALRRLANRLFGDATLPAGQRDAALLLVRLGLAFPMLTSVVFTGGVFDNPFNTTLPVAVVGVLGVLLVVGLVPRWLLALVAVWLVALIFISLNTQGLFAGLDDAKREIGMLAATVGYLVAGPDRWSWPHPIRIRCREVTDLLMSYMDHTLSSARRRALDVHFADCPDCWRFVGTYQQTVTLARQLRAETMPAEVYDRLDTFVRTSLSSGQG